MVREFNLNQNSNLEIFQTDNTQNKKIDRKPEEISENITNKNEIGETPKTDTFKEMKISTGKKNTDVINGEIQQKIEVNFNEHIDENEFEIKIDHLDRYKKAEIEKKLCKYKTVFAKDKYDVSTVKEYEVQ